ncbi:MAG: SF1B family DNA helicase RecD2, partial [Leuconostoc falkenbergense]
QDILMQDPYRLVFEFEGINFKKADEIGRQIGVEDSDQKRLQAAVYAAVMRVSFQHGHTYLYHDQLRYAVAQMIHEQGQSFEKQIEKAIARLISSHILVNDDGRYYPNTLFEAEVQVSNDIQRLQTATPPFELTMSDIDQAFVTPGNMTLDETQISAVKEGLNAPIFLLTGGPGTGKTTIIRTIVATWQKIVQQRASTAADGQKLLKQYQVRMASPTGRAAKRMTEVTGHEASTIHRLLGISDLDEPEFNADNPIAGGLLIIDEASMLDIELTAKLLAAVPNGMKLIVVGDSDQLPSVGPGNVLADLVNSQKIAHVELAIIYRQGRGSSISDLAANVKKGRLPSDFLTHQPDRSAFMVGADQALTAIQQIVTSAVKKGFTQDDLQILTPMYKSSAGVNALNQMAQALFNPIKPTQKSIQFGALIFRKGDKVLQLENDSERDVYNGDMGKIIAVQYKKDPSNDDNEDRLIIDFDGKELAYPKKNLNQLTLAYATTVHKAQGNEFKLVILALTNQFGLMLNRNLLYTGLTRAKEALILVGEYAAFQRAAETLVPPRQTFLQQRLNFDGEKTMPLPEKNVAITANQLTQAAVSANQLTVNQIIDGSIDPMIGMANISPYDFM